MNGVIIMRNKDLERIKVMQRLALRQITQIEAGKLLHISDRQIRKLFKRYQQDGDKGLISNRLGRPSNHQLSQVTKKKSVKIIAEKYPDFGPTLAAEKLRERHAIVMAVETVRQLMISHGLWVPERAKPVKLHPSRARRPCIGELVIIDGSVDFWFEDRGPKCVLLVFIDDASSRIGQLWFTPTEDLEGYFSAMERYVQKHGRPLAIYADRHAVFQVERKSPSLEREHITQFERAMRELDIKLIHANSPQAKGRVERCNRTLQDRLIKELRLHGISDIHAANQFAEGYCMEHNRRFAVVPSQSADLHRAIAPDHHLERILRPQYCRLVQKDLTFQYNSKIYQIQEGSPILRGKLVMIWMAQEKQVHAAYEGHELKIEELDQVSCEPIITRESEKRWAMRKRRYKPNKTHPYRTKFKIN